MTSTDLLALIHTGRYVRARWQTRVLRALGWIALVCTVALATPACDEHFSPVQQLTVYHDEQLVGSCTAFAIKHGAQHVWLSAAHCADDADRFYIAGLPAPELRVDGRLRLAAFDGPQTTDTVALAHASPERPSPDHITAVTILGYPAGWSDLMMARGVLSNPAFDFGVAAGPALNLFAIYNVTVAHGNSGSPVFTDDGKVIGLMQLTLCDDVIAATGKPALQFCPESAGTPVEFLHEFLRSF